MKLCSHKTRDSIQLSFSDFIMSEQGAEKKSAPCINQNLKPNKASIVEDYMAIKASYPDRIIMYQVGAFFEMLGKDAKNAAKCLALTLTWRKFASSKEPIEMCGIPDKHLDVELEKLCHMYNVAVVFTDVTTGKNNVQLFDVKGALAISDDDIDEAFKRGSGFVGGKQRIYDFFCQNHTNKEKADFLKKEYGIGGRSNALPGSFLSDEWHDVKGIKYSKPNCSDVMLNWPNVVKRIDRLIAEERYITVEEPAKWAEQTKTVPEPEQTTEINNIEETVLENKDIEAVEPKIDNMLKVTSDGRKLGLDQRIINSNLPDEENTKVNMCVQNILKYWREGEKDKLTQLVFCDISTPQAGSKEDEQPEIFTNVYADIKRKLIAGGMEPEQVAFIHEAKTDLQKKELFAKVRSGQVRVLIGSTAKMGAGTNCQDRLIASHDLDCPWRPRDLIQREGRIRRQGNMNKQVHVCRYVTEATFDAYLWQTIENKQKFISQIMTSKSPLRSCEDVDEAVLSYAEIKALCAGDPRIKERMELDVEVNKLKIMKANHQSQQYKLQDQIVKYFPEQINKCEYLLTGLKQDKHTIEMNEHPKDGFTGIEVGDFLYKKRSEGGAALLELSKKALPVGQVYAGRYRGFDMCLFYDKINRVIVLRLNGSLSYEIDIRKDAVGNIVRIDNVLGQVPDRIDKLKNKLSELYRQHEAAKVEVGKPFEFDEELGQKAARLIELDMELNIDAFDKNVDKVEQLAS